MHGHEVDHLGSDLVGRNGEVALILTVLVIDDYEDLAIAEIFDRLRNGSKDIRVRQLLGVARRSAAPSFAYHGFADLIAAFTALMFFTP